MRLGAVVAGGRRAQLRRGDPGWEHLRVGILLVMPGLPGLLVMFYNRVGDARPPATLLPLPLASTSDWSSASGLIQTREGRKGGGGARVWMTLRLHPAY